MAQSQGVSGVGREIGAGMEMVVVSDGSLSLCGSSSTLDSIIDVFSILVVELMVSVFLNRELGDDPA